MSRGLRIVALSLLAAACHGSEEENYSTELTPRSLPELLVAHDIEVARHGRDMRYIEPIGEYGREGVTASVAHLEQTGVEFSSYDGIALIFGVAEQARVKRGYDICRDVETLGRILSSVAESRASKRERENLSQLIAKLCKLEPQKTHQGSP